MLLLTLLDQFLSRGLVTLRDGDLSTLFIKGLDSREHPHIYQDYIKSTNNDGHQFPTVRKIPVAVR